MKEPIVATLGRRKYKLRISIPLILATLIEPRPKSVRVPVGMTGDSEIERGNSDRESDVFT